MSSPFDVLTSKVTKEPDYDEWGGQFLCSTVRCPGYAKIARYYPEARLLVWQCEHGHKSKLEDIDE